MIFRRLGNRGTLMIWNKLALQAILYTRMLWKDRVWRQKARMISFRQKDLNTKYFHALLCESENAIIIVL